MNIERKEFLQALKRALPGVEAGNVILEGADTFIFADGYIHSYNDNISVSVPFPIVNKKGETVSGALKAKDFYDLINRLSGTTLNLFPKESAWVVKAGNSTAELTLLDTSIISHVQNLLPGKIKWNSLPERFMDGLAICKFSANKSVLSGVFAQDDLLLSTDNIRVNSYKMDAEVAESFWISDSAVSELVKLNNPKKYFISKAWIHFLTADKDIFSCKRLAQDKYPVAKLQKLLTSHQKEKDDISNDLPESLMDAVNRAAALSQNIESFDTIKLTFTKEHIEVFSQRPSGKFTENVAWTKAFKKDFKPIAIFADYAMIENGIKHSKSFYLKRTIAKEKETTRIIFVHGNGIQLIATFDGSAE